MYLKEILDDDILRAFNLKNVSLEGMKISIENPEVDLDTLARRVGCDVQYRYMFTKSGSHNSDTKIIEINSLEPRFRQRFTLAHEIGHNVLNHRGINYRDIEGVSTDYLRTLKERQANKFAADLLMPSKLVREVNDHLSSQLGGFSSQRQQIVKIADMFHVSYLSMEYRLKNLGILARI